MSDRRQSAQSRRDVLRYAKRRPCPTEMRSRPFRRFTDGGRSEAKQHERPIAQWGQRVRPARRYSPDTSVTLENAHETRSETQRRSDRKADAETAANTRRNAG